VGLEPRFERRREVPRLDSSERWRLERCGPGIKQRVLGGGGHVRLRGESGGECKTPVVLDPVDQSCDLRHAIDIRSPRCSSRLAVEDTANELRDNRVGYWKAGCFGLRHHLFHPVAGGRCSREQGHHASPPSTLAMQVYRPFDLA